MTDVKLASMRPPLRGGGNDDLAAIEVAHEDASMRPPLRGGGNERKKALREMEERASMRPPAPGRGKSPEGKKYSWHGHLLQ